MSATRIAPYVGGDLGAVVSLLANALTADPVTRAAFVRKVLLDPNFDAAGAPVARIGGAVAGFALAIARRVPLEDAPPDPDRGYVTLLAVAPEARGRGVGSALLADAEAYLEARGRRVALVSPYAPGYWTPGVDVRAYPEALRFLAARGYSEVYRPVAMDCALPGLSRPAWVHEREAMLAAEGVRAAPCSAEQLPALLAFLAREFPGDWQRLAREAAASAETGDRAARLWTAAGAGGEVLGFSHHDGERFGPIGVAAAHRGRGLGQVLMYKTLEAMRAEGLHAAWFLWSDDRTAERLYAAAGFRETRRFAVMRKELGT
ncbi:MAG: GNAT family N-acetyltransferase [Chthonomonadales bacterium]|nr:GNAT family N-acetyltransferase [Chthonomonadales bacterium]